MELLNYHKVFFLNHRVGLVVLADEVCWRLAHDSSDDCQHFFLIKLLLSSCAPQKMNLKLVDAFDLFFVALQVQLTNELLSNQLPNVTEMIVRLIGADFDLLEETEEVG